MEHASGVQEACPGTTPAALEYAALLDRLMSSVHLNSPSTQEALTGNLPELRSMDEEDNMAPEPEDRTDTTAPGNAQDVRSLDPNSILENLMRTTEPNVDDLLMRLIQNAPASPRRES